MRLYIDKENIMTFIDNRNNDKDLFDECLRTIKKGMEVYYNFPKSDIFTNPILTAWFGRMKGSGVKFESIFCPDAIIKPDRPVKSNFYVNYNYDDRGSIFLLNIEDSTRNAIRDKHSILVGRPGDEFNIINMLIQIPENKPTMMREIISWGNYCPQIPLTDVIISDNHYFKTDYVYKKNDNELIRALASIPKDSFNLILIAKEGEIDSRINLENEYAHIKEIVASTSGLSKKKCSVTIITTNRLHSRHIITNYYRVTPTSCVHLKESGLKEDANIMIQSHTDPIASNTTRELIKIFQSIADNPVHIYGDKVSNFISFNK